jgi:hypothetical protein
MDVAGGAGPAWWCDAEAEAGITSGEDEEARCMMRASLPQIRSQ